LTRQSKTRALVDGEECIALISAKITPKAYQIYKNWRDQRKGGARISRAIINSQRDIEIYNEQSIQIRALQTEISELRVFLKQANRDRHDLSPLVHEMRELYTPQRPPEK